MEGRLCLDTGIRLCDRTFASLVERRTSIPAKAGLSTPTCYSVYCGYFG